MEVRLCSSHNLTIDGQGRLSWDTLDNEKMFKVAESDPLFRLRSSTHHLRRCFLLNKEFPARR